MRTPRKMGVIGVGHVGAHVASQLISRQVCDQLILLDTDATKVAAHAQDLNDSAAFNRHPVQVTVGDYQDLADADIVVVSASGPLFREDRLEELNDNLAVMDSIIAGLKSVDYCGLLIAITNPCDVIAWYLAQHSGCTVLGTGTLLDSARLRAALARETGVAPQSIQAYCLGEHGDSQLIAWSSVTLMGMPLTELAQRLPERFGHLDRAAIEREVIGAGWQIVLGKGATEFGIGAATAELALAILHDEQRILPCSVALEGHYGEQQVYASVPCLIGRRGVVEILPLPLDEREQQAFAHSCARLRSFHPVLH